MRQKIVAGNWKMNTSIAQGKELVHGILDRMAEVPRGEEAVIKT